MPFVSLAAGQKDFSWVAFLQNLQILACDYRALRPILPVQSVRELKLDCTEEVDNQHELKLSLYSPGLSIASTFPHLQNLRLNGIPAVTDGDIYEDLFTQTHPLLTDIQCLSLAIFELDSYPYAGVPVLTNRSTLWGEWNVTIDAIPYCITNEIFFVRDGLDAFTASLLQS